MFFVSTMGSTFFFSVGGVHRGQQQLPGILECAPGAKRSLRNIWILYDILKALYGLLRGFDMGF
jgi:hypothetical protein